MMVGLGQLITSVGLVGCKNVGLGFKKVTTSDSGPIKENSLNEKVHEQRGLL